MTNYMNNRRTSINSEKNTESRIGEYLNHQKPINIYFEEESDNEEEGGGAGVNAVLRPVDPPKIPRDSSKVCLISLFEKNF